MLKDLKENAASSYKETMNKINIVKLLINGAFKLFFLFYYIYLIWTHKDSVGYAVCYSILLAALVVSFIIEILLRNKMDDTKDEKKEKKIKRRRTKAVVKAIKLAVKFATIMIAMNDIRLNGGTTIAILLLYVSLIVLILQIIFTFVMYIIKRSVRMAFNKVKGKVKDRQQRKEEIDEIDYVEEQPKQKKSLFKRK